MYQTICKQIHKELFILFARLFLTVRTYRGKLDNRWQFSQKYTELDNHLNLSKNTQFYNL